MSVCFSLLKHQRHTQSHRIQLFIGFDSFPIEKGTKHRISFFVLFGEADIAGVDRAFQSLP